MSINILVKYLLVNNTLYGSKKALFKIILLTVRNNCASLRN